MGVGSEVMGNYGWMASNGEVHEGILGAHGDELSF